MFLRRPIAASAQLPRAPSRRTFILAAATLLGGCGAAPPPRQTTLGMRILVDSDSNRGPNGQPLPILVRLYALRSDMDFQQTDFLTLFNAEAQALGQSLVSRKEFVIPPGGTEVYVDNLPTEAAFIGVMAAFRSIDQAQWRAIAPLQPGVVNDLQVNVVDLQVVAQVVRVGPKPFALPI
ncbi:type VI secretion system lipoprotein TssJ [Aquabacter sp. L1I39]|uniref:type VI secretion system lipoprotein TssJ n=1 Tax=Aquabacter sp. L1I39 TaxID=2820278 RepID=UPI001ADBD4EB|nr:type VI secretion system lipoprotein TssJ [Aquabacter sp. L1I39]QTL01716.1 type VI secretion system lipoprotein TssJ [Aquabacter sp. L1I39]